MTYLSGRAEKKRKITIYTIYIAALVALIIFWPSVKTFMYPVFEPVIMKYYGAKSAITSIPQFFSTYTTTRSELEKKDGDLEITIERLENELAKRDAELKELNATRDEIHDNSTRGIIVMYPLMQDITRLYSTILLSKGYKDGVEVGAYVFLRGLQPVCIIKEVYNGTSLCQLLSSADMKTDAVTVGSSSVSFTLIGRGGGTYLANVPRDTKIALGDSIYLKSDPSMLLGTVADIIQNNQDTSWHVFVRGRYNPVTSSIFYLHKK